MKKLAKLMLVMFMATAVFTACSKNDDPADNDLFVGTYKGKISYAKSGQETISKDEGSVTVIKVGNNYNFQFSDGIPNLNGVEFKKDENSVISIGSDEAKYIKITKDKLTIGFTTDGAVWTANGSR